MNRLRDLREDHDLLQKDIAKILGMSQTGYSQYETETNDIPTAILKKLANYFLCVTNEKKPYPKANKIA